jgi:hypothetical protein
MYKEFLFVEWCTVWKCCFITVVVFCWVILTRSKHLLMHCLLPNGLHGKGSGCSWRSAALPFGGSWLPLTNWPLRNTPHTQGNDSMVGSVSPRMGGMRGWKSNELETSSLELKQRTVYGLYYWWARMSSWAGSGLITPSNWPQQHNKFVAKYTWTVFLCAHVL